MKNNLVTDTYRHKGLRRRLAETVKSKGIYDENVLRAIATVPRHTFLDSAFDELAYTDQALQIGEGQTISQPYTVAYQSQTLEIKPGDKVLEIGLGSGYQACILMEMGADVYSIERIEPLYKRALEFLPKIGYKPNMFLGDGTLGLPKYAPFDKIIVTAASPGPPKKLLQQLAINGIMVVPIGDKNVQTMYRYHRKSKNEVEADKMDDFRFVPLIGKEGWSN
jgi:protein-L-isoaspartate(D-aspartate) O-methyltransferase